MYNSGIGRAIQNANPKLSIIPTILAAGVAIYLSTNFNSSYLKYGIGFWILWGGVLCLVAHTFLYKKKNNDSFEQPIQQSYVQSPPIQNSHQNQQTNINQSFNSKFCPSCGNKVDNNIDTCFMCGHKF